MRNKIFKIIKPLSLIYKIYAIGGYGSSPLNSNDEYNTTLNSWTSKSTIGFTTYRGGGTSINNKGYLFGGIINGVSNSKQSKLYDVSLDSWSTKTNLLVGMRYQSATSIGSKGYNVNGYNTAYLLKNYEYDSVGNSWGTKTNPLRTDILFGLQNVGGNMYLFGGLNSSGKLANTDEYNQTGDSWATKTSLSNPTSGLISSGIDGKIYSMGGNTGTTVANTYEYDPILNTWVGKTNIPSTLSGGFNNGKSKNSVYVISGSDGTTDVTDVYSLNVKTNSWTTKTDILNNGRRDGQSFTISS